MLSHNVFKKSRKEKSNKLQTGLIEEVARFYSNAGMNEKMSEKKASLHVITLVTADWYGSGSSWLISQIKINETMKLFLAKLLRPN